MEQAATYNQGQGPSAFGVDQEQGWDGSNDLDSTIAQRRVQGLYRCVPGAYENTGTVKGDDCKALEASTGRRRAVTDC